MCYAKSFLIDSGTMEFYCVLYIYNKDKRDWMSLNVENARDPVEENMDIFGSARVTDWLEQLMQLWSMPWHFYSLTSLFCDTCHYNVHMTCIDCLYNIIIFLFLFSGGRSASNNRISMNYEWAHKLLPIFFSVMKVDESRDASPGQCTPIHPTVYRFVCSCVQLVYKLII